MTLIFDPKLWIWDQVRCAYVLNIFPTKLCKSAQGPQSTSQQTDKQTDGLRVSWYRFNSIVTQDFYIDAHMTIWPVKLLIYRHDDTTLIWRIYWVNTTLNITLIIIEWTQHSYLSEHNMHILSMFSSQDYTNSSWYKCDITLPNHTQEHHWSSTIKLEGVSWHLSSILCRWIYHWNCLLSSR